jgi:hypothetical protein
MKLTIVMDLDQNCFTGAPSGRETARILREAAGLLEDLDPRSDVISWNILDKDRTTIGSLKVE